MAVALGQAHPHAAPLLYVRDEWRDPATLLALQQGLTQAQCTAVQLHLAGNGWM